MLHVETHSPEETEKLGRIFGSVLLPGSFVALYGDLGGGKTCFTRGVVSSITPENAHMVASPTFAIMNEYHGRRSVYHFDFYRLHGSSDLYELGFETYFDGSGICIAEWAERLEELLPDDALSVTFTYQCDTCRTLQFKASGVRSTEMLELFKINLES